MDSAKQLRLRELTLIMLRDEHGEDFTAAQAALLPAQRKEYRSLTEPGGILSLLDWLGLACEARDAYRADKIRLAHEVDQLRAELAACRKDAERYRWLSRYEAFQWWLDGEFNTVTSCIDAQGELIDDAMAKEVRHG